MARTSRCAMVAGSTANASAMAAASTPSSNLQHQRCADVRGDGGMGANQHQLQPPVRDSGHVVVLKSWHAVEFVQRCGHPMGRRTPHVAQPVACHGEDPALGCPVFRRPATSPAHVPVRRQGVLGGGDVAVGAASTASSRPRTCEPGRLPADRYYGVYHPRSAAYVVATGRISTEPQPLAGLRCAHFNASSRLSTSMTKMPPSFSLVSAKGPS